MPSIISDHMVLKMSDNVAIWGKADPGENVTVTFAGEVAKTADGPDGKWSVGLNLKEIKAEPSDMVVEGKNKITIHDVAVGEVWIASGQSNMEAMLRFTNDAEKEIAQSANPMLREFKVAKSPLPAPADDVVGKWVVAAPETANTFSATGYYFGKALQRELQTPVGTIVTYWGGTSIEPWISAEGISSDPDLKHSTETYTGALQAFPSLQQQFASEFERWLQQNGQEDHPPKEIGAYAGREIAAEGWLPVTLPCQTAVDGLAKNGAIWLRREVEIPPQSANKGTRLFTDIVDNYDSIYWNGESIQGTTYTNHPGIGAQRGYDIPGGLIKQGTNILAIRIYAPFTPVSLAMKPKLNITPLTGQWLAKTEYEFPALDAAQAASAPRAPFAPRQLQGLGSYLFNGMISPLLPYTISGVIWYQGESNTSRACQYRSSFPLLIKDWRKQAKQGDLPFYFCQLANFNAKQPVPTESAWAELREAQSMALRVPNTGQAVLIDVGESGDIHPRNKKEVGERLAKIALAKNFGRKGEYSGPVYASMKVEGSKIRLRFTHSGGELVAKPLPATYRVKSETGETAPTVRNSPQCELEGFAITGEDHKWVWADAKIDGESVVVWSDKVPNPVAVRYAWADNPTCNLYNGADLPAGPFRTDDFPLTTLGHKY